MDREPYWQKTYRLMQDLREHLAAIPAGEIESLLKLLGDDFAYLRLCEDRSWIAAFYRDGEAIEAEGRSPERALENLIHTRAGAEPATSQADHDGGALGRTEGSIPSTGAKYDYEGPDNGIRYRDCYVKREAFTPEEIALAESIGVPSGVNLTDYRRGYAQGLADQIEAQQYEAAITRDLTPPALSPAKSNSVEKTEGGA